MLKKPALFYECANCHEPIIVKFCPPRKKYVCKNNWGYWTEKKEDNKKYICSGCLREKYYRDFLNFKKEVTNPKKMNVLRVYLSLDIL